MTFLKSGLLIFLPWLLTSEIQAHEPKFTVYAYIPWDKKEEKIFTKYGIKSINVIYEKSYMTDAKIDKQKIRELALETLKDSSLPVSFDIEPGANLKAAAIVPAIQSILKQYRAYNTKNLIGLYATIPQNTYGRLSSDSAYNKLNSSSKNLIFLVDFISPSLYNYDKNDFTKWWLNAQYTMNAAKKYSMNKPIIPYISPIIRLSSLSTIKNGHVVRELSEEEMTKRLDTLYSMGASGCIIWASSQDRTQNGQVPQFNPQNGWGKAVVTFIKTHR